MKDHINYPDQSNCAHGWANQLSTEGHSSNLFFDGNIIFSYGRHFPIAILDHQRVFFTTRYYSRSTAKQKGRVLSAVSHLQIIYVPFLPNHFENVNEYFVNQNVDLWIEGLEKAFLQFSSKKGKSEAVRTVRSIISQLEAFVQKLGLKPSSKLRKVLRSPLLIAINGHDQQMQLKATARAASRLIRQTASFASKLLEWRTGSLNLLNSYDPEDGELTYLRFNGKHNRIETSKAIKVPIDVAKRFYSYIINTLNSSEVEVDYEILNFKVKLISKDFVIVGCHKIPFSEIRSIASRLSW